VVQQGMVQKWELAKCKDDLRGAISMMSSVRSDAQHLVANCKSDINGIVAALQGMVPKGQLLQAEDEKRALSSENDRLLKKYESELRKSQEEVGLLSGEVAQLEDRLRDMMVLRSQLQNAKDTICTRESEIQRLQQILSVSVLKIKLESAEEEARAAQQDNAELSQRMRNMKSKMQGVQDMLDNSELECLRLKQTMRDMVPKERLEELSRSGLCKQASSGNGNKERSMIQHDKDALGIIQQQGSELERLKLLLEDMKSKYQAAEVEIKRLEVEQESACKLYDDDRHQYRRAYQEAIVRQGSDVDHIYYEVKELTALACRLHQKLISSMVPQVELDSARDEINTKSAEISRLNKAMASMVSIKDLEAAQEAHIAIKQELDRMQVVQQGMVQKWELAKCKDDLRGAISMMSSVRSDAWHVVAPQVLAFLREHMLVPADGGRWTADSCLAGLGWFLGAGSSLAALCGGAAAAKVAAKAKAAVVIAATTVACCHRI
jgi:hypothetical protein